jgi:cyanate lyase
MTLNNRTRARVIGTRYKICIHSSFSDMRMKAHINFEFDAHTKRHLDGTDQVTYVFVTLE